jgi:site-specific DNA recombinase
MKKKLSPRASDLKSPVSSLKSIRCAIYTRKSTEERLDLEYHSLDAQRDAALAYIASQRHEGWKAVDGQYDDGGFSGGNADRPALLRLLEDIKAGKIDCVVVYKVDRLSRSLLDFARIMGTFDEHSVAFVSVTQQFNTSTPMGRLVLNVLLSFAQFERELIAERIRDKIAAQRRRGKWAGGRPILGYDVDRTGPSPKLVVNATEAAPGSADFRDVPETWFVAAGCRRTRETSLAKQVLGHQEGRPTRGTRIRQVVAVRLAQKPALRGQAEAQDGTVRRRARGDYRSRDVSEGSVAAARTRSRQR